MSEKLRHMKQSSNASLKRDNCLSAALRFATVAWQIAGILVNFASKILTNGFTPKKGLAQP